jgi:hypothetical protein
MRAAIIVVTSVVVLLAALGSSAYLWWHKTYDLPGASCGRFEPTSMRPTYRPPQCFAAAAQECKPAGINVWLQGTESARDYVFTIGPGGRPGACPVAAAYQDWNFVAGRVRHASCQRMSVSAEAIHLDCADISGDFTIPLKPPAPPNPLMAQYNSAPFCGNVPVQALSAHTKVVTPAGYSASADLKMLRCFAAAAKTCSPASIVESPPYPSDSAGFAIMHGAAPPRCWVVRALAQPPSQVPAYDKCVVTSVSAEGVLLACGAQPFLIPATVAP